MGNNKSEMVEQRVLSHLEMCKYAGIRKLGGLIKQTFGCGCKEEVHCGRSDALIFLRVVEKNGGFSREINDSFALPCGKESSAQLSQVCNKSNNFVFRT